DDEGGGTAAPPFGWGVLSARSARARGAELARVRDEHVLVVLARPATRAAVHGPAPPLPEPQPSPPQAPRIEVAPVVDDNEHGRFRPQRCGGALEYLGDPRAIRLEGRERRSRLGRADLPLAPVVEAEELVRVAVLLVVVDQARIRRRREH